MFLDRIPVRWRLALGHSVWMALLFVGVGSGLYRVVEHNLYQTVDNALMTSAKAIRDNRFVRGFGPGLMEGFLSQFFGERYIRSFAQLVDLSGKASAKTDYRVSLPVSPRAMARAERGEHTFETIQSKDGDAPVRMITLPVTRFGRFTGQLIQVGTPLQQAIVSMRELAWVLWVSLPLGLVLSFLFGYLLTARAFKPVKKITTAAADMGSDDLSVRLPIPEAKDELRDLTQTFNEMLDRLEDAFKRLRRFNGDVSHELRTPLAVLRGEADLALRRERSPEDYRQALKTIAGEASNMTGIIDDLLLLARAESRSVAMTWMPIIMRDFIAELGALVGSVYETNDVRLNIVDTGPKTFEGHASYLSLALKNIMINAAKHSAPGSLVHLEINSDGPDVLFTITDSGEGIPEEAQPYVFDPFYRADTVRNRAAGGTGIGLSLAMALVRLHGGSISLMSKQGSGASFTIRVPPAPPTLASEHDKGRESGDSRPSPFKKLAQAKPAALTS